MTESKLDRSRQMVDSVLNSIEDIPIVDGRAVVGGEQYHPDIGHYFRYDRVEITGDMNDISVLRIVSKLCDEHGLEVDNHNRGYEFYDGDHVILKVDDAS